jgi:spore maturation protein CgeB
MALKKICIFPPISPQYGVVDEFTLELSAALKRQGVENEILKIDHGDPATFLQQILNDPPQCTLSFNGLLPDNDGRFLCDMINIPHVACLTDAPTHYFSLLKSPLNIITCVDKNFCKVFTDVRFPNVLFMPHAANGELKSPPVAERKFDVLVLNSFIDYEAIHQTWTRRYSPELCKVLEEAAELTFTDYQKPYLQAFVETLDKHLRAGKKIDPRQIDYEIILDELEAYIGGKNRMEMLQAIEGAEVHVFGSNPEGWKKYLSSKKNIHVHEPVPFKKALELMQQAKIILNCTPEIKQGMHERILNGLACGAAVLTIDTPFMKEQFKDGENIQLFPNRDWKEMNKKIETLLKDESKRAKIAEGGRQKVLKEHTWDQRAAMLIKDLPPILDRIKKG